MKKIINEQQRQLLKDWFSRYGDEWLYGIDNPDFALYPHMVDYSTTNYCKDDVRYQWIRDTQGRPQWLLWLNDNGEGSRTYYREMTEKILYSAYIRYDNGIEGYKHFLRLLPEQVQVQPSTFKRGIISRRTPPPPPVVPTEIPHYGLFLDRNMLDLLFNKEHNLNGSLLYLSPKVLTIDFRRR